MSTTLGYLPQAPLCYTIVGYTQPTPEDLMIRCRHCGCKIGLTTGLIWTDVFSLDDDCHMRPGPDGSHEPIEPDFESLRKGQP